MSVTRCRHRAHTLHTANGNIVAGDIEFSPHSAMRCAHSLLYVARQMWFQSVRLFKSLTPATTIYKTIKHRRCRFTSRSAYDLSNESERIRRHRWHTATEGNNCVCCVCDCTTYLHAPDQWPEWKLTTTTAAKWRHSTVSRLCEQRGWSRYVWTLSVGRGSSVCPVVAWWKAPESVSFGAELY